jgi:hypothetical protein
LQRRTANKLVRTSGRIFYQDRTAARVRDLLPKGVPLLDLKAIDAGATLAAALRSGPRPSRPRAPSSLVRRARLPPLPQDPLLTEQGLRRALLAGQARELGLRATAAELRAAELRWQSLLGVRDREALLSRTGLRPASVARLCEELALERLVLDHASRMLSDGPSREEALADELRLRGHFGKARR